MFVARQWIKHVCFFTSSFAPPPGPPPPGGHHHHQHHQHHQQGGYAPPSGPPPGYGGPPPVPARPDGGNRYAPPSGPPPSGYGARYQAPGKFPLRLVFELLRMFGQPDLRRRLPASSKATGRRSRVRITSNTSFSINTRSVTGRRGPSRYVLTLLCSSVYSEVWRTEIEGLSDWDQLLQTIWRAEGLYQRFTERFSLPPR